MAKKGTRPRAQRRERERHLKDLIRDRERLVRLEPGGAPERAILVPSVSVIEGSARSTPCHQCDGELALLEHAAERQGDEVLRVVRSACKRCHAQRAIWFRLGAVLPS